MQTKRLISQQNIFDFALQHFGDLAAVFEIADSNPVALPDGLLNVNPAPVELRISESTRFLPNFYKNRNIQIATGGVIAITPPNDFNWILAEDGTPLLAEDDTNLLYE